MAEPILGSLYRAEADSITGWCWCAMRPRTQCGVEVLIDGIAWRTFKSDRRFEGARLHGPPHDHFGFLAALPPRAGIGWHRIEVREQRTGQLVGRLMEGGPDPSLSAIEQRIDLIRRQAEDIGAAVLRLPRPAGVAELLGAIGTGLLAPQLPALSLAVPAAPSVTLVLTGCGGAAQAYRAIESLAGTVADIGAELVLLEDLRHGGLAELAAIVRGLQLADGADLGTALETAINAAGGRHVLVLDGARVGPAPDLARWLGDGVTVGPRGVAQAARRRVPLPAPEADETGLIFGIETAAWRRMAGVAGENLEAVALDLAAQAQALELPLRCAGPVGLD